MPYVADVEVVILEILQHEACNTRSFDQIVNGIVYADIIEPDPFPDSLNRIGRINLTIAQRS